MMRYFLLTIMAMMAALTMTAESNCVYIEDFELDKDSTITVPVFLANETRTRGLQFNIVMPEGLLIDAYQMTPNSVGLGMNIVLRTVPDAANTFVLFLYPSGRVSYPPDTVAVMTFTFTAEPDFTGGNIILDYVRGATINNQSFVMDGDTVTVTVPSSSLIGIPMEQEPVDDRFFNLQGTPITDPDSVPVAIQVITGREGVVESRKVSIVH